MDTAKTGKSPESRSSSSPEIVDEIPGAGCSRVVPTTIEKASSSSNTRTVIRRLMHVCKYDPETEKMVVVGRYYETKDIPLSEAIASGSGKVSETVDSEVIPGEDKSPSPEIVEVPYIRPTPRVVDLTSSSSDERISPDADDASTICQICNQSFPSQLRLEDHEIHHHMKDIVFLCNICKQRFITAERLQNHECIASVDDKSPSPQDHEMQSPKDEIVYSCTVCKKQYVTLDSLLNHECTIENREN